MFIILDQVTSFAQDNFFLKNCDWGKQLWPLKWKMQRLRDNKAVSMVAPNRNFITDQVVTLTTLDTKMTKCFPQLVSKLYIHKYITCRLCKETVTGKVGFHHKHIFI